MVPRNEVAGLVVDAADPCGLGSQWEHCRGCRWLSGWEVGSFLVFRLKQPGPGNDPACGVRGKEDLSLRGRDSYSRNPDIRGRDAAGRFPI